MIFLFGLFFYAEASAATLESAFAARLMRARRVVDVERLRSRFDHARVARLGCTVQIARDTAPLECYALAATERAWHVLDEVRYRRRRRRLDAACARASLNLRVPDAGVSLAHVSAACVARVREARLNREYQRDDHAWSGD